MNTRNSMEGLETLRVRRAMLEDVPEILALGRRLKGVWFPWGERELISQLTTFPEGQFVLINPDNRHIMGALGTLVISRQNYSILAKWDELTEHGTFKNHDRAHGKTLLRSHLIIDPRYDAHESRDLLSRVEMAVATRFNLDRIRVAVRFREYYLFHNLGPQEYFREVEQGLIGDPWIRQTLDRGFVPLALVGDYYPRDWRSEGYAVVAQLELRKAKNDLGTFLGSHHPTAA